MRIKYRTTNVERNPLPMRSEKEGIMILFKQGDKKAFTEIFEQYHGLVLNYVYRICQNRVLAEEVVQDVFTRLWTHRNGYNPEKPFEPYLLKMARNRLVDKTRRQAVRKTVPLEKMQETLVIQSHNTFDLKELQASYEESVQALPESEREVFILSRVEGLKYSEIAEVLEISPKTVEVRMTRALEFLRNRLKPFLEVQG